MLTQRRLRLLAQVVQHGSKQLIGLLSTVHRDGRKLSWVRAVRSDMVVLFEHAGSKLHELGHPEENAEAWWSFIRAYPHAWACHVRQLRYTSMSLDEQIVSVAFPLDIRSRDYACSLCSRRFLNARALSSHVRAKHAKVSDVSHFVGK